ncbi:aspartate/glutamate racemase family protein [Branchiibius sp. NY16-3462-2]|uniref:aspartate/glutamate racemase family protein n=1 Tax=Branchiibius sp. NY16-3462-2 TaxID=1807500 RepID=UPI0007992A10|nr:aspartate/glutamate racemase family protein [Branchiibius sp. NY16-3462-2]KYH44938.1 hypothetical protein AZH51_13615 [Branchiibius sp. NY16-3462-2]
MHIRLINPNTTSAMTDLIGRSAAGVAGADVTVDAVNPSMGPASIESHYEEALAVPGLLEQIALGNASGVDGFVVACFGDPGLDAARELSNGPVLGIAEAAFHAAAMVGRRFSVMTTLSRTRGRAQELLDRYGFADHCAGVHACDIPVLELESLGEDGVYGIAKACREAVERDDSDAVVLGCAGMADFCAQISQVVGVPVIDGVVAATGMVQGLIRMGVTTSRRGEYAAPPVKEMTGLLAPFEIH